MDPAAAAALPLGELGGKTTAEKPVLALQASDEYELGHPLVTKEQTTSRVSWSKSIYNGRKLLNSPYAAN